VLIEEGIFSQGGGFFSTTVRESDGAIFCTISKLVARFSFESSAAMLAS
jgi:hypothetical protein